MSELNKIIGYENEKEELKRICDILKNKEKYSKLGIEKPNALLIHGEPGLGKTLMAKCLIKESGRKVFECRKNMSSGSFVEEINNVFSKAIENEPSIVFLDDMDKFAEDNFNVNCNKEEFVTIQSCFDEIKNKDVFVIATANNIRFLPDSLLRVGRFGRQMEIKIPNTEDSIKIISHYVKGKKLAKDVNSKKIAMLIKGYSCATLENIINEAGIYAGFKNQKQINFNDIISAFLRVVFKNVEYKTEEDDKSKIIKSYHEAGHAVLSMICGNDVSLLMIKKYGDVSGGCLEESENFFSIYQMRREVLKLLAGKASVDIQFNFADVGVKDDLERATSILRKMIEELGVLGFDYLYDFKDYSDKQDIFLQSKITESLHAMLEKYYRVTKLILFDNKKLLDELARELLNDEIIFYDKIEAIKNKHELNFNNYTKEFYYM